MTVKCQKRTIIHVIADLEEEYIRPYKDGDNKKFSIRSYLRGFVPHEEHPKKQIKLFVKL